jgi:DDE superfamily endonuclease
VIGSLHQRHRTVEFLQFLKTIDENVPAHVPVHLVLDNASIHKTAKIQRWLAHHLGFTCTIMPTSSSWINLVERRFGELMAKLPRCGAHRSIRALNTDIRQWIDTWDENPCPPRPDQDRRANPRHHHPLRPTNQPNGTPAGASGPCDGRVGVLER